MTRFVACCTAGLLVAASAHAQELLPVDDVEAEALRAHVGKLLRALDALKTNLPADTLKALRPLLDEQAADNRDALAIQKLLDARCLAGVSINAESRVKAARGPAVVELRKDEPCYTLVKIQNDGGVTHPLALSGPQIVVAGKKEDGRWLEAEVVAAPPLAKKLSGARVEYVVVRLTAREAGKREATFRFDVGQGTQDLGYRAEVPILFRVR